MKKALLVIDYIQGIAAGNGSCADYIARHPDMLTNTNKLIDHAHQIGQLVYPIRLAFDADYSGLPKYAPNAAYIKAHQLFRLGDPSTDFLDVIHFEKNDTIINKTYGDIFQGNHLLAQLKENKIEEVILIGGSTDNAIINSANTAMLNNFYVTIITDACGAPTQTAHDNALAIMKGRTASRMITTQEAIQ